jgi:hypothetical protein
LLIPYEWRFDKDRDVIVFSTSNGLHYEVQTTLVGDIYFSNFPAAQSNSYEFCFDIKGEPPQKLKYDKRIALTIIEIVRAILNKGSVIIFVCDSLDNRQKSRHTLFTKWFASYGEDFEKYDVSIEDDSTIHYVSLLFDPKQQNISISQVFQESLDEYASYKNTI